LIIWSMLPMLPAFTASGLIIVNVRFDIKCVLRVQNYGKNVWYRK